MKLTRFKRGLIAIAKIGARPQDDEALRLQKSILILFSIPFMFAGILWGCMYIHFGAWQAGLIPLIYGVFSLFSLVSFSVTGQFRIFRFSQLLLILLLPFLLMAALGGFINGSAVILWGLISPLGAMLLDKPRNAPAWFTHMLFS